MIEDSLVERFRDVLSFLGPPMLFERIFQLGEQRSKCNSLASLLASISTCSHMHKLTLLPTTVVASSGESASPES